MRGSTRPGAAVAKRSPARAADDLEVVLQLLACLHDGVAPAEEAVGVVGPPGAAVEEHPGIPHRVDALRELAADRMRRLEVAQVVEEPAAGGLGLVPALLDAGIGEDLARPAAGLVVFEHLEPHD